MIIMSHNVAIFFQNLWHLFEHITESKNHVIESLLKELDDSEEQYARNLKSHTEIIDQLIGM
jgi:predicted DNA-binding ribbon-helix-helix protein